MVSTLSLLPSMEYEPTFKPNPNILAGLLLGLFDDDVVLADEVPSAESKALAGDDNATLCVATILLLSRQPTLKSLLDTDGIMPPAPVMGLLAEVLAC